MANYVIRTNGVITGWGTATPDNFNNGYPSGFSWEDYAPPSTVARIIKDWQFRNRFTEAQLVGIMRAAMLGDDVAALVWLRLSTASDGVDLDDPANVAGVQYVATLDPSIDPLEVLA